ncbi:GumC family protein [Candidatus Leptofilum sp.]|uniref:GumC family protein n=1 Tax=Candidatus Leptofilum sp. TaxID=3241576 RepID=UPI003B5B71DA
MEEELDLRPFIEKIIERWKLIIFMSVLAAIAAFIISSILPVTYQATSLIAYFESDNIFQFDQRITEIETTTPFKSLPELAKSDEVLTLMLENLPDSYGFDRESLAQQLSVSLGDDASIMRFTASANTPQSSAELANLWAETFIIWANNVYSNQNGEQVQYFEEQLAHAEGRLDQANQNLSDFFKINSTLVLSSTLQVTQQNYVAQLEQYNSLQQLTSDAEALQQLILAQGQNTPVSFSNQLAYLQLQLEAFGGEQNPIFLQTSSGEELAETNSENQVALLTSFQEVIEQKLIETNANITDIEAEIISVQQQLQDALIQESELVREVQIASATVTTLGLKLEEEIIAALDTNDGFKLISAAALPKNPVSARRVFNTAVAGALGFSLALVYIVLQKWWQDSDTSARSQPDRQ